ncbi:MAG: hypothetical protein HQK50_05210 [Oligoflexia bacterium]|nr:hypothetical protein [Oligoflexia bacterium]
MRDKIILPFLALIALIVTFSSPVSNADQARSYAITKWDGDCSGSQRDWWDDMCMKWRNTMKNKGWSVWWNNFNLVRVSKFVDPAISAWGVDNGSSGIDQGNATMLCTHGGYDGNGWYGKMHTKENGECAVNLNQMKLGTATGGKLRFLHLSSCNSIRWDQKEKWFGPAAGKVHVITGFHGLMYIGYYYVGEYGDLANEGFSRGVGKVWVDRMHHVDHWYNVWKTVCPIALGFGDTETASAAALNERYNSKYPDRSAYWMTYRWKSGCDPDGASKLPN